MEGVRGAARELFDGLIVCARDEARDELGRGVRCFESDWSGVLEEPWASCDWEEDLWREDEVLAGLDGLGGIGGK